MRANYLIKKATGVYKNRISTYSSNTPKLYDRLIEPNDHIHQQFLFLQSEANNYVVNCSLGKNIFTKLNNNV